jgi:hypothetical protein
MNRIALELKPFLNGATAVFTVQASHPFIVYVFSDNDDVLYVNETYNGKRDFRVNLPVTMNNAILVVIGKDAVLGTLTLEPMKTRNIKWAFEPEVMRPFNISDIKVERVPFIERTPARIFVRGNKAGTIQINEQMFKGLSQPTRMFILLHELGHYYFATEHLADSFALYHYLNLGYNFSSAQKALTKVLKAGEQSITRITHQNNLLNGVQDYE